MLQSDYERVHQYLFFPPLPFFHHRQTFQGSYVGCGHVCLFFFPLEILWMYVWMYKRVLLQLAGRTTEIGSTFFGADGVVAGDAVNASMVVRSFVLVVVEEDDFAVIQSLN